MKDFRTALRGKTRWVALVMATVLAGVLGYTLALSSGTTATASPALTDSSLSSALTSADGTNSQFRTDLQAAHALHGQARISALQQIRTKALAGDYGPKIKLRAERRDIRRDLVLSLLPSNLQTDLAHLRSAPADQRKELRKQILTNALAGDYGPQVKAAAEKLQVLRSQG